MNVTYFLIASIVGIGIGSLYVSSSLIIACVLLWLVAFGFMRGALDREHIITISLCAVGITLGLIRVFLIHQPTFLTSNVPASISFTGVVVQEPTQSDGNQSTIVRVSELTYASSTQAVDMRMLVRLHSHTPYTYGDVVSGKGSLTFPKVIEHDGVVFDYPMYLYKSGVVYVVENAQITKVGSIESPLRIIFTLKNHIVSTLTYIFPGDQGSLLSGMLIGTNTLSSEKKDAFRIAGLSHIVVLSGYNVTIVSEYLERIGALVSSRVGFSLSGIGIWVLVLMSGSGASAVRAGAMATVLLLSRVYKKKYSIERTLLLVVWCMIMWNPMILLFDPSFHLSVLATVGILYLTPLYMRLFSRVPEKFGMRELCASTCGAQSMVTPYILYMSGNLSLFSLPVNVLLLPLVPVTMLFGFVSVLLGSLSLYLALIFSLPTQGLLLLYLYCVEFISNISFASIHISFSLFAMLVTYLCGVAVYRYVLSRYIV